MESVKLEVNRWMHTEANFDGIIEFGALLAGPIVIGADGKPAESYWEAWNCFDFTHSNTAGYQAMGNFIDLSLFKNPAVW